MTVVLASCDVVVQEFFIQHERSKIHEGSRSKVCPILSTPRDTLIIYILLLLAAQSTPGEPRTLVYFIFCSQPVDFAENSRAQAELNKLSV